MDVKQTAEDKYEIVGGELDGDTGIYVTKDGVRTGEVLGQSLTKRSFFNDEGKVVEGAVIDTKDKSGQNFIDQEIIGGDPNLGNYATNARNGEHYDFKDRGVTTEISNKEIDQYRYRGMPFIKGDGGKVYATARDIGNYGAGYVAGKAGLVWGFARIGFDAYQSYSSGRLTIEGQTTQAAQKLGHTAGLEVYKNIIRSAKFSVTIKR